MDKREWEIIEIALKYFRAEAERNHDTGQEFLDEIETLRMKVCDEIDKM